MRSGQECKPYYTSLTMSWCSGGSIIIPLRQLTDLGAIAFQIWIQVSTPFFEITSNSSLESCNHVSKIRIWADQVGIHTSFGGMNEGEAVASVPFQNVTGELSILVVLQQEMLTLAVRQGAVQFVTTVKAKSTKLCSKCDHEFVLTSNSQQDCLVNTVQVYNCKPQVSSIYVKS